MIAAPPLGAVVQGVAGLFGGGLEAQGFSPNGETLLVRVVYTDSAYPLLSSRTAFWMYDLSLGQYSACINNLIATDRPIEVSDVAIATFNGQTQLIANYRDTDAGALNLNKLALIRNGVLVQSDLVALVSGNQADAMMDAIRVSANGRFLAVETAASNLASGLDTNGLKDIYLFDLVLNTSRRITTINGAESNFDSSLGDLQVGADGALSIAFESEQAFTTQDANGVNDVFVWRLASSDFAVPGVGSITLGSRTTAGAVGGSNPKLNAIGLVFNSDSSAFSSTDQNSATDVWQSTGSAVNLVALQSVGSTLTGPSSLASSSASGRYVAVVTASPEVAGQTGVEQLLLVDTLEHSAVVVSKTTDGVLADDAVISPVLSGDGSRLAFSSMAGNLGAGQADGEMHLYLAEYGKNAAMQAYVWKSHTLLSGVALTAGTHSSTSDALGAASFTMVTETSLSLTATRAIPTAEASATTRAVNLLDAIAILKMIVGLPVNGSTNGVANALSPYQALAADFNTDGEVGLQDAIEVLKMVVGLTAPEPSWHFLNELDASVAAKATLKPGTAPSTITADLSSASPVHVGLVAYLSGDVDGSYAGATGASDLDITEPSYFVSLVANHPGVLSAAQFGG
ncbi:MAG: hypothetical protein ACOYL0_09750 [Limnohabitans sp.]